MKRFETLFDPITPAHGPPPGTLWAYGRWALRGAGPTIWLLAGLSTLAGITETASAWLVGWVVDLAAASPGAGFLPAMQST